MFCEGPVRSMLCAPLTIVALLTASISALHAQHDHGGANAASSMKLGAVAMPNSGAASAQAPFLEGLAAMHSFEYAIAAKAFREAQQRDPSFALAYWGEAMTHNHPVWNRQQADSARAILARLAPTAEARHVKAPTARERDWLHTVEVLYASEGSKARRDTLYLRAMEQLVATHPNDTEAQAFLALAWLGLNQAVRSVPDYMRAGAIASAVLQQHPEHPGAAHYVIHAFDDPDHAPLGLPAARAYSQIAPDAPHAQHMTTHIFLALGMWEETVAQNVVAQGDVPWRAGHYTSWWHYGLTQLARERDAKRMLDSMRVMAGGKPYPSLFHVEATHALEFDRWDDPVFTGFTPAADASIPHRLVVHAMQGIGAWRRGDATALGAHVAGYEALMTDSAGKPRLDADDLPYAATTHHMLLAARDAHAGRMPDAIGHARTAALIADTLPADFGPPIFVLPPQELLGELLLDGGEAAAAKLAYQRALQLAPGRSRALAGLVRAARASGDDAVAENAMAQLENNWKRADPVPAALTTLRRVAERQ